MINSYYDLDEYTEWFLDREPCLIDIEISETSRLIPKVNWNSDKILPEIDESVQREVQILLED